MIRKGSVEMDMKQLGQYKERNLFLRGMVPLIGYKTATVTYARKERLAGESKYPLKKMLSFAWDGITSFSIKPISMIMAFGGVIVACSMIAFIYTLVSYFMGHVSPGWSSLMISICHNDAYLMQETLTNYCDYDFENLELNMLYIGDDNTPQKIYEKLTHMISESSSDDTVMLYFAGHGMKIGTDGFLILPDTKQSDIANTSLELKKINEIMSTPRCNCFIILDACHSGLLPRGEVGNLFIETISDKSCVTLASCSENERSYPDEHLEQGIFALFLCQFRR